MPATFVSGNLFAAPELDAIGHGCNCAGAMGKGIALEFKKRFGAMYREYKRRCTDGTFGLGDVFFWEDGEVRVFNLGTQKTWRTKAELDAIETSVQRMLTLAEDRGLLRIGLPQPRRRPRRPPLVRRPPRAGNHCRHLDRRAGDLRALRPVDAR